MTRNPYIRHTRRLNISFLTSFRVLWWLFFHPSALRSYLSQIHPQLPDADLESELEFTPQLKHFLMQIFLCLPGFSSLCAGLILLELGESVGETLYNILGFLILSSFMAIGSCITAIKISRSAIFGLSFGVLNGVFLNPVLGITLSVEKDLLDKFPESYEEHQILIILLGGLAGALVVGLSAEVANGKALKIARNPLFPLIVGLLSILMFSNLSSLGSPITVGIATVVGTSMGLYINFWRPVLTYPLSLIWGFLAYLIYSRKPDRVSTLLKWNAAFWDEYQYLPLWGLDNHLVLASKYHPLEAEAALNYLRNSKQSWLVPLVEAKVNNANSVRD